MARTGDVIENPITGQRLLFRKTAEDTGGDLLEVESQYTRSTSSRPPVHYHPGQEERFEVLSGRLSVRIGDKERTIEAGGVLIVPAGVPHGMWAEEAGVRANWQTRPALKTEAFFETIWGLARDGKTDEKGVPNVLRSALIAREYEGEFRLASPPWVVQRVLFGVLAPIGRLLGYDARYPYPDGSPRPARGPSAERSSAGLWTKARGVVAVAVLGMSLLLLLRRRGRRSRR